MAKAKTLPEGHFFGHTKSQYSAAGLILSETDFAPEYNIPIHRHHNAFFCLISEGSCVDRSATHEYSGIPSALIFHPAGKTHSNYWPTGGKCFHIEFTHEAMAEAHRLSPALDRSSIFRVGKANWIAHRIYEEFAIQDSVTSLALQGLGLELLAAFSRAQLDHSRTQNPPHWLLRVRELLHQEFTRNLSLSAIAAEAGVHPAHLSRSFRRHFGNPIGEYVRGLRVQYACRMLKNFDTSLANLALEAGFADQSHFSKVFKRRMGVCPAEFQRSECQRKLRTKR